MTHFTEKRKRSFLEHHLFLSENGRSYSCVTKLVMSISINEIVFVALVLILLMSCRTFAVQYTNELAHRKLKYIIAMCPDGIHNEV